MSQSNLIPLVISLIKVLLILVLESFNGAVQFKLTFSLDDEDFILELGNQILECVLRILMALELLFIAFG
jgi:hypothetical protein